LELILVLVAVIGGTVGFIWLTVFLPVHLSANRRLRRLLRRTPRTFIADAPEGVPVKIIGKVRPVGAPLTSLLGQVPSVLYHADVYRVEPVGRGLHSSILLLVQQDAVDFFVEDSTGSVRVCAAAGPPEPGVFLKTLGPRTNAHPHFERFELVDWVYAWLPPEAKERAIAASETRPELLLDPRYEEQVMEVGAEIALYGVVTKSGLEPAGANAGKHLHKIVVSNRIW
jgi:hypothetical protein